jgi:hypothetical protein
MLANFQQKGGGFGIRGVINLLYLVVSGHATCVTPFVRRNFGSEALGRNGAIALIILVVYMVAYPTHRALVNLGGLWFLMVILQRLKTGRLLRKGFVVHSRFDGEPFLGFIVPFVTRYQTASFIEFLALLIFGIWIASIDAALSRLVVVSAVCLVIKMTIEEEIVRKRLRAMRNAEVEQRSIVERYRRGDF